MQNLVISQKEKVKAEEKEVKDLLNLLEDFKHHIYNIAYQNSEIKGEVYFINIKELEKLPHDLVEMVDDAIERK